MAGAQITKSGDAPLVALGHTIGTNHGTNPMSMIRGESGTPTPVSFGGGKTPSSQGTSAVGKMG